MMVVHCIEQCSQCSDSISNSVHSVHTAYRVATPVLYSILISISKLQSNRNSTVQHVIRLMEIKCIIICLQKSILLLYFVNYFVLGSRSRWKGGAFGATERWGWSPCWWPAADRRTTGTGLSRRSDSKMTWPWQHPTVRWWYGYGLIHTSPTPHGSSEHLNVLPYWSTPFLCSHGIDKLYVHVYIAIIALQEWLCRAVIA